MRKNYSFLLVLLIAGYPVFGQSTEIEPGVLNIDGKNFKKTVLINNPKQDESFQVEISNTGITVFTSSNNADGTINSFRHNQQITLSLLLADKSKGECQLVFYSDPKEVPQTANLQNKIITIYYPINLYEVIKEKIEQTLTARKKIYVKVIQKTNGYREGSLIL